MNSVVKMTYSQQSLLDAHHYLNSCNQQ